MKKHGHLSVFSAAGQGNDHSADHHTGQHSTNMRSSFRRSRGQSQFARNPIMNKTVNRMSGITPAAAGQGQPTSGTHKLDSKKTAIQHRPSAAGLKKNTPSHHHPHHTGHRGHFDSLDAEKLRQEKIDAQKKLEEIKYEHEVKQILAQKTHFSLEQIEALMKIHKRLLSLGKMDRLRFRETTYTMLGITDDLILDRMFNSFDGDTQAAVSATEWILGLNVLFRGTLEEQIAYCYEIYDLNNDRGIGRDELRILLKNCINVIPGHGVDPDELSEYSNDIIEIAMRKLDVDGNGIISYADFYDAVQQDPLLLEALGQCLPQERNIKAFLALFADDYTNFSEILSHPLDIAWDRERDKFNRRKLIEQKVKQDAIKIAKTPSTSAFTTKKDRRRSESSLIASAIAMSGNQRRSIDNKKLFSANAFQRRFI